MAYIGYNTSQQGCVVVWNACLADGLNGTNEWQAVRMRNARRASTAFCRLSIAGRYVFKVVLPLYRAS